ncbi:MAG: acylphosphatase [Planctomycetota bacterium]
MRAPRRTLAFACAFWCAAAGGAPESGGLETDVPARRVRIAARVAKQGVYAELKGAVEYALCNPGGKAYEALFVTDAGAGALRDALVRIGLSPGRSAQDSEGVFRLPAGGRAWIFVEWDDRGERRRAPLESFVLDARTGQPMRRTTWAFTGSREVKDPGTGKPALEASLVKNLVSLHQLDSTVLIQNPLEEARDSNRYRVNPAALPPEGSAVTIAFEAAATRRLCARVRGRLDGVGYRAFVQRAALSRDVRGSVRRTGEDEMEISAEGEADAMKAFESDARTGPRGAKIDSFEAASDRGEPIWERFEIDPIGEGSKVQSPKSKVMERTAEDHGTATKDPAPVLPEGHVRVRWILRGRVQGVGFRAFTQDLARRVGLRGFVRNLPTGEVEIQAEGGEDALRVFESGVRNGPPGSEVGSLERKPAPAEAMPERFEVRPTPPAGAP